MCEYRFVLVVNDHINFFKRQKLASAACYYYLFMKYIASLEFVYTSSELSPWRISTHDSTAQASHFQIITSESKLASYGDCEVTDCFPFITILG